MIRSIGSALLLAVVGLSAQAKTVTINAVVDASVVTTNWAGANLYSGAPYSLSAGDTLNVNFSFLPGQALQITNPSWLGMMASAVDQTAGFQSEDSISATFTGLTGPAHNTAELAYSTLGAGLPGNVFPADFMDTGSGTISFTGISFNITVLSYGNGLVSNDFTSMNMYIKGDSMAAISAVPEPADFLLFSLGLAALGWVSRRSRKR